MSPMKILDIDDLASLSWAFHRNHDCLKIVHAHGCFDLLHIGHIKHLQAAKRFGTTLFVTVTPDRFVNKGPGRPRFNERLRVEAIAALQCVDYVAVNKWQTAVEAILEIRPSVFVKGQEYRTNRTPMIVAEEEAVRKVGGRIEFTDELVFSSTELLKG